VNAVAKLYEQENYINTHELLQSEKLNMSLLYIYICLLAGWLAGCMAGCQLGIIPVDSVVQA
jgi:hypothetical protein